MEGDLLPSVARGDRAAVESCVNRYGGLIWSLALRLLDRAEAEDAVQDVFIELWRHADRFDPTRASEKTFVAMIARRRIIDRRRTRSRDEMASATLQSEEMVSQDHQRMEMSTEVALAAKALEALPAERREVVSLSVVQGLTHSEIAKLTGLPIGTVKSHLRRGLAVVRDRLVAGKSERRAAP